MVSLAIIPLLLIDIGEHRIEWEKEVWNETMPSPVWKPVATGAAVMALFLAVKILVAQINSNRNIQIIRLGADEQSIQQLLTEKFGGKVVYVDFWGTTCGPCIQQFMNFTWLLKDKYKPRDDIGYLYIARGCGYLWKKQIQKYDVQGYHIF